MNHTDFESNNDAFESKDAVENNEDSLMFLNLAATAPALDPTPALDAPVGQRPRITNKEATRRYRARRLEKGFAQINAIVDVKLAERLREIAKEQDSTVSAVVGLILKRSLKVRGTRVLR